MQISATDVIHAFRKDEPCLFIGAASVTVGLVVVGFLLMRRRFDRLLSFFAWFAILYGERLWLTSSVLRLMESPSLLRARFGAALTFFVAVPAFLFFQETGLLGRAGRVIAYTVCLLEMALIAAIFAGVPLGLLYNMNSGLVIAGHASPGIPGVSAEGRRQRCRGVSRRVADLCRLCALGKHASPAGLYNLYNHRGALWLWPFLVLSGLCRRQAGARSRPAAGVAAPGTRGSKAHSAFLLPASFPVSEHFTVAARYVPMTAVAGDFYEFSRPAALRLGCWLRMSRGMGYRRR